MTTVDAADRPPTWLEMESVLPLSPDVEAVTSLSRDAIKRNYGRYVVQLSPKREGMKLKHALAITNGTLTP
jgi:hypothetical protein